MSCPPSVLQTRRRFLALTLSAVAGAACPRLHAAGFFRSRFGVCAGIDQAKIAKTAGLGYLEIGLSRSCAPSVSETEFQEWLALVKDSPLPALRANLLFPGDLKLVGPQRNLPRLREYTDLVLGRAARAGVSLVTLGSGGSRRAPEGMRVEKAVDQFTESCREIMPIARKHGLTIAIEPLNRKETNVVNRLSEVCAVVDAVGDPRLGATADIYHMLREEEGPEALIAAGARVRHCHIAEKKSRTAPGVDGDDFTGYFSALRAIDYRGLVSLECRWTHIETELSAATRTLSHQWRQAMLSPKFFSL